MLHVLILCIRTPHLSWKWNGKFTHNFISVFQLIRGLFGRYFNGSSYKLLSNEGEITESTMWSYKKRDWLKRWQISTASALTEIVTTWLWCTVLHKICTGPLDFQKLEKDLQCKEYLFWPLKAVGDCGSTVVKVLCYKLEGRWFNPRWCHWNFSLT